VGDGGWAVMLIIESSFRVVCNKAEEGWIALSPPQFFDDR